MPFTIFRTRFHPARNSSALQMIRNRMPGRYWSIRLGFSRGGNAALHHAPMIQDARDVLDLGRSQPFGATQRKIIILRTFQSFAETADLAHDCMPVNPEMADAILSKKELWVPIGFKVWPATLPTLINLVFIRINQARSRMGIDGSGDKGERVLGQEVILIQ